SSAGKFTARANFPWVKQVKAGLWPGGDVRARRITYLRLTDTILVERPQVATNKVTLVQRWCTDRLKVVNAVCAAFQMIAEQARSDRADDEGGAGL
ncbi:MAG: hypothetical protein ACRECZ_06930, partial [Methylocella sp.]